MSHQNHLSNLRSSLTALVIYHHTSSSYGGLGSWGYMSPLHKLASSPSLIAFNAINQSHFMGLFFLLSGHLSSASLEHKAPNEFLLKKLVKLGVPAVIYSFAGPPLQHVFVSLVRNPHVTLSSITQIFTSHWTSIRGIRGPVWFSILLIIFDSIHVLLRSHSASIPNIIANVKISVLESISLVALSSYMIRLSYPVGRALPLINLQAAFLPQYIAAYTLGCFTISPPLTAIDLGTLLSLSVGSTVSILTLLAKFPSIYPINSFAGGPNLVALAYAFWNESTGYLIGVGLLRLFGRTALLRRKWGDVDKWSYAAFLVHPVVGVGVQVLFEEWAVGGVTKSLVLGTISVIGSWAVGWSLGRWKSVRKFIR